MENNIINQNIENIDNSNINDLNDKQNSQNTNKNRYLFILLLIFIIISDIIIVINFNNYNNDVYKVTYSSGYQEIPAFNSNFTTYQGKQTGSQVKALITYCIANAKTYSDEPKKVPAIKYSQLTESDNSASVNTLEYNKENDKEKLNLYTQNCTNILKKLELKHTYRIILTTGTSGLIETITIQYNQDYFGIEPGSIE